MVTGSAGRVAGFSEAVCTRTDERTSIDYQDARFWASQEESLEGKYRLEPGAAILRLHTQAEQKLTADLVRLQSVDPTPANQALLQHMLVLNASYTRASAALFRAVNPRLRTQVTRLDDAIADPLSTKLQNIVYGTAQAASSRSPALTSELRDQPGQRRPRVRVGRHLGPA